MRLLKIVFGFFILLGLFNCTSGKDKGFTNLLGEWTSDLNGNGYEIKFTKVDTMITGEITHVPSESRYSTDQVLFKDIKFLNDTTIVCKGLFMKEVYTTVVVKQPTIFNWGGDDGHGNKFVDKKIFDHYENIYVDYRLELHNNSRELVCKGFSEGVDWNFCRPLSLEEKKKRNDSIEKENRTQKRIMDSIESVREHVYNNGNVKRRDFNPPITLKFKLVEKRFERQVETENGSIDEFSYTMLPTEREIYITTIFYRSDGKYDKIIIKGEKDPRTFWYSDKQLWDEFSVFIKPNEMGDSLKVFNSLKKYYGVKEWEANPSLAQ